MRTILFFTLLLFLSFPQPVQSQRIATDSIAIAIFNSARGGSFGPNGRGKTYIATGYIIPWNIYVNECNSFPKCGFMRRDSVINKITTDSLGIDTSWLYYGTPVGINTDTSIVIGEWDCRGMILENTGVENDSIRVVDNSTQTFIFYDISNTTLSSPCPNGCTIVTEGPVVFDENVGSDNIWYNRTIVGATNQYKTIRGDVRQLTYSKNGQKSSSNHRIQEVIFHFNENEDSTFLLNLDVSVDSHSITIIGPIDTLGNPGFASNLTLEGVIYSGGTFTENGATSGMDENGNATIPDSIIGIWTSRGWWISNRVNNNKPLGHNYTLDDGFVMANQQTFEFNHPVLGAVQIMTEGRDFSLFGGNIVQRAIVGATGALAGHRGECVQNLLGKNNSGGFNFSYSFETNQQIILSTKQIESEQKLSLFPNPTSNHLTIVLDQIKEKGDYDVYIFDVTGRIAYQRELNVNSNYFQLTLDVSEFSTGWYGLVLKKGGLIIESQGFVKTN